MASKWNRKFWAPIHPRAGKPIQTLAHARAFLLALPRSSGERAEWQRAVEAVMAAAEGKESLDTAREKLTNALFLNAMLDMEKTKSG